MMNFILRIVFSGIFGNFPNKAADCLLHSSLTGCISKGICHGAGLVQHQNDVQGHALPWDHDLFTRSISLHSNGHIAGVLIQRSALGKYRARIRLWLDRKRRHGQQRDDHTQGHDRRQQSFFHLACSSFNVGI